MLQHQGFLRRLGPGLRQAVEAAKRQAGARPHGRPVRRWQRQKPIECGGGRWHRHPGEKVGHSLRVQRRPQGHQPAQRGQGGGKRQAPADLAVKQWLFAEAVTGQRQAPAHGVPEGEGEHAIQPRQKALKLPLLIPVHQHLAVRGRAEGVAAGHQFPSEAAVVVDLAVEDDGHRPVTTDQGLIGRRRRVDHAQPAMTQCHLALTPDTLAVGAALAHGRQCGPQALGGAGAEGHARYATHALFASPRTAR